MARKNFRYFSNRFSNSNEFYQYLKGSFDMLYEERPETDGRGFARAGQSPQTSF
jgi:hypothetical protein